MKARRHSVAARLCLSLLSLAAFIFLAVNLAANLAAEPGSAVRYVAPGGNDGGGANLCLDPAAPCATLRQALTRSAAGDTVRPAAGVYAEGGLVAPHALTLAAEPGATLDGSGGGGTILTVVPGAAVIIEDLTLRGGTGERGGALRVEAGGDLTLRRVAVSGNRADWGGGVYLAGGRLTVEDSHLSDNQAGTGGAVYAEAGEVGISGGEVGGNRAGAGGGLALGPGVAATLRRVVFVANAADTVGGAIQSAGALAIANSVLRDNRAGGRGGGLFNDAGTANVDYATFLDNDAPAGAALAGNGATRLGYSLVRDAERACDRPLATIDSARIDDGSCGVPADPPTGLLADGRLVFDSNAIDAGPPICVVGADTLTADVRGEPRPANGGLGARCDLGAYEFQPRLTIIVAPSPGDDTRFDFDGDLGAFTLAGRAAPRRVFEVSPGLYRLAQAREPGWKTTVTCDGDTDGGSVIDAAGRAAAVDVDAGEHITCVFGNRAGRETVGIALDAPAGTDAVAFEGDLGAFTLRADGQSDTRGGRLAPGAYGVRAMPPPGLRVTAVVCLGDRDGGTTTDPAAGAAVIDLDAREVIGCTFTLAPAAAATLTVRAEAEPAAGAPLVFTGDLGLFTLQPAPGAEQVFALPPGVYRIHELLHPQWSLGRLDCAGGDSAPLPEEATAVVTLAAGQSVVCTFGHVRAAADTGAITIVQTTDPVDGTAFAYDGALGAFSLSAPGAPSRAWAGLPPGVYSVRQLPAAGWALGSIACAGGDGDGEIRLDEGAAVIDLDAGEAITCAFANARPSTTGAITIVHEAAPPDGTGFRYQGTLGGFTLNDPGRPSRTFADLPPGSYTVSARPLDGWTPGEVTCEGDDAAAVDVAGATIDLDAGEAVVCRFRHWGAGVGPTPTPTATPPATPPPGNGGRVFLPVVR